MFKPLRIMQKKERMEKLIAQYKENSELVYNTWFVNNEERLKAFRSIRRGVIQIIEDIKNKTFPNDFKESSLEFVLTCITEQKQVFEGAAHPFYWKPKLRIPDIYENRSEEHTSELQSHSFISYAVFCLKKKKKIITVIIKL